MTNLALLYPSQTLASIFDPDRILLERRSLSEVREKLVAEIQQMLVDAQLERLCSPTGETDRWYWAAPLLLDRNNRKTSDNVKTWLQDVYHTGESIYFQDRSGHGGRSDESNSKTKHFEEFTRCFHDPLS